MGFNLFGDAKKSDIKVGYISTDRGYVEGVNLCEANRVAELNPGTTFILKNRKRIEYKNINEVNNLKPIDAFVKAPAGGDPLPEGSKDACSGITLEKPYGPPKVEFFGGGGVGVKGNAVVGKDGGILGVHIISGGHGYKYPPIVKIKDGGGNRGGGTVAVAGLGQTSIVEEIYDAEDEFEEYFPEEIKNLCHDDSKVEAGRVYSPDGKDLGPWDPSVYINDEEDPIKRQIQQFQEYLAALTDPWWFTRKEAPLSVVSANEEEFVERQRKLNFDPNRTVYPVHHPAWGGRQLDHGLETIEGVPAFQDVVFEVYTQGGKGKDLFFTFTEVGGKHTFTVKADDYTDSGEPRKVTKKIKPNVDYKVTSDGRYKKKTGTEQGLLRKNFGSRGAEKGLGTSSSIFADVLGTANDNDDLQILAKTGRFKSTNKRKVRGHSTYDLTYKLIIPETKGKVSSSQKGRDSNIAPSFMNDHAISPVPMSNAPGSDFAGMLFTMEWEEEFPYPGEYTFKGQCDNVARAYLDNQPLMPNVATWKDKPTLVKKYLNWEDSDKKGKVYKIKIDLTNALEYKDLVVQEPPQKDSSDVEYEEVSTATAKFEGTTINDLTLVVSGAGTAECTLLLDTNDNWRTSGLAVREMRCGDIILTRTKGRKRETLTGTAKFPAGRYPIQIIGQSGGAGARIVSSTVAGHDSASLFKREGISTKGIADTRIELDDDIQGGFDRNVSINLRVKSVTPERRRIKPPAKPKPASTISGIKVQKVFNTVDWMGKANRQLWRTNVVNRGGFINAWGVCPFDTSQNLDTNPYAGTHSIQWKNVNFPVDGNYTIKVAVDDNVNLRFHGTGGEVIIYKDGFVQGHSTGTSTYTRFFKKGNYTLDADLEQIPGGRFSFRQDGQDGKVKDKEVSFKVTSSATYANKITIPGLFSVGKDYKGSQINQNFMKMVEVGKEYDVILTSEQQKDKRIKLRIKDNGRRLEMEEYKDDDFTDMVCTVTEGQFYSIQGNRCKFKLGETVKGINPMSLAVDVEVAYATKTVVSAKSWNENPMGVAFTIKAPLPPTPIEEVPKAKGRCPNNPMWTTRFPSSSGSGKDSSITQARKIDTGLRNNIKEWYNQRWNRTASETEIDNWIGTGKSASAIRKGILGHQADIAGVLNDGPSWGGSSGSRGDLDVIAGGQWYPVRMSNERSKLARGNKWSKFLNRYAVSPVLPLSKPGSDAGGQVFTNTWNVDIPYDGYYQLKGEVDDIARYYIDDDLKLDLTRRKNKIRGTSKFFLTAGIKTLRIEVENYSFVTYKNVSKKVFSARDWRRQPPVAPPPPSRGILCHAGGGVGGTDNQEQLIGGKVKVGKGGDGGKGGDDNMYDSHHGGTGGGAGLRSGGHAQNPLTHKQIDAMSGSRYKGGPGGFGVNFEGIAVGSIQQTFSGEEGVGGNGVAMGGGGGGNKGKKGARGKGGDGGVKIIWGLTGKSQTWTTPGVYTVTVPGGIGKKGTAVASNVTAKFEGTNYDNLELVVTGSGKAQCTIKLDTHDSWTSRGVALTAMRCGSINLTRTKGKKSETLTGSGTFVGGKRYKVEIIGADKDARQSRIADTRVELLDRHKDDTNASLTLSTKSEPTRDGVTIVCIGGGGSGFMDTDGDKQGSGGSGGAYAWVNEDVESGKKLKVVVGKGGKGGSAHGGARGTDSYVEVVEDSPPTDLKLIKQKKGEVTYSGPNLFHYTDKRWGKVMNRFGVSPANVDANLDNATSDNVGDKILEWKNVNFPFRGQYDVLFAADNKASLYINGEQLLFADENFTLGSDKSYDKINIGNPGRYDVKIQLLNAPVVGDPGGDIFRINPCGVVLEIRKDVSVATSKGKSWVENPVGVSGVLIPPPCPKEVGGKGIVDKVEIIDPGNGFEDEGPGPDDPVYDVAPIIKEVIPPPNTINYNCGVDKVIMEPDLGYKFSLVCDNFGKIKEIPVTPPPQLTPVPFVPEIWIDSATGVGPPPTIVFDFPVVPPDILPPEDIIQVTDLAGIKQTGYYNGKPYYGAVYYDDGIKYAGWYETAGQRIQIYDTLQESIDATITTPPSAIQRQGSDVSSNDPRLNIPGTPENLT